MWLSQNLVGLLRVCQPIGRGEADDPVPFLFSRNIAYWYWKICQPPTNCFATAPKQAWHPGRYYGLGERRLSNLVTLTLTLE
jgi:hypothetical protein